MPEATEQMPKQVGAIPEKKRGWLKWLIIVIIILVVLGAAYYLIF